LVNLGTSLQLLLTQEIVRRQGEDTQEDSLTDTQVWPASSLYSLIQRQREDSLTYTQVRTSLQPLLTKKIVQR
jgi:hypothetical protein